MLQLVGTVVRKFEDFTDVVAVPLNAEPEPVISQITTFPEESRHRMSDFPSPSKSPVSAIVQIGDTAPSATGFRTDSWNISQTATSPVLVLRQRMSAKPSPLKSPVPAMIRAADCSRCRNAC